MTFCTDPPFMTFATFANAGALSHKQAQAQAGTHVQTYKA